MEEEKNKFESENEMVDILLSEDYKRLKLLIGSKIKKVYKEKTIPLSLTKLRKTKGHNRIDIFIEDVENRIHIIEVKRNGKDSEVFHNSQGIAQLLYYDALLTQKDKVNIAGLYLVSDKFDIPAKEMVVKNNLNLTLAKLNKDKTLDVIISFHRKRGRPKEYKDSFVEEVYDYILECVGESKKISKTENKLCLPTVEGLAIKMGFAKETLYQWGKEKEDFSDALEFLKSKQCVELIDKGLKNKYNSQIVKLILSANHKMRERSDITSDDKELPTPIYGGKSNNNQE